MKLKPQNEKLSIINSEGNILIVREGINNGKSGIQNTYFLQGICSQGKNKILVPLDLMVLIQYFENQITLKELFLFDKNQKYFLCSGIDTIENFIYTDDSIFDTIECGDKYYNQLDKGMKMFEFFPECSKKSKVSLEDIIQNYCPMYRKHHNIINGISMLSYPKDWEEIPHLDSIDSEDEDGELTSLLNDIHIYNMTDLGITLPIDSHGIKETIFVVRKDEEYFLCETQGYDFIKFSTNISRLSPKVFNRR